MSGSTQDRRDNSLVILEKLGSIETNLAVNTEQTKGVKEQLTKLNGTVGEHEKEINGHDKTISELLIKFGTLMVEQTKKAEEETKHNDVRSADIKRWIERVLWIAGVLAYAVLTRLDIVNL